MINKLQTACLIILSILVFTADSARAQSEFAPWGNILGIRRDGQLFNFETSLKVVGETGRNPHSTYKEAQRPKYIRNGNMQTVTTNIDNIYFTETVTDISGGKILVNVQTVAKTDTVLQGIFFCITIPKKEYVNANMELQNGDISDFASPNPFVTIATGTTITSSKRNLKILFGETLPVTIRSDTSNGKNDVVISLQLKGGSFHKGDTVRSSFTIKAWGQINKQPVEIAVDTTKPGRPFDGLGGNFRLQNPTTDPQVIDYCLANLRVAWGRVEMPWRFWQPKQSTHPGDSANMAPQVIKAMEMAQRLSKMNIPVILTAWAPPAWAIIGKPHYRPVNGVWGNPLNPDSTQAIYQSITDYIKYLKQHYGVEAKYFSFNESDLGINIRVTPDEHDALIKGLGAYFAAHGLQTKMLLGDNSDANSYKFIYPALNDADAKPYIGAVSFHSWRGWDTETLEKWADAATKINKPLIVGEGSTDAQAFGYPQIFQEPSYALQEINLYTRLLNICQPLTILQWQLTADYSPLIGGGIFGNNEPLHPGQRFWNLKQLSVTPEHLYAMPVNNNTTNISCAALGDNSKGIYTLHLVNNGTTRKVTIRGLPANIRIMHFYTTNAKLSMQETDDVKVENGKITFELPTTSYCTLIGGTH
jgi:hypothetical protein